MTQDPNHQLEKCIILKVKIYNTESFNLSQVLTNIIRHINNSIIYSYNSSEFESYMIYQRTLKNHLFFSILIKFLIMEYKHLTLETKRKAENLAFSFFIVNSKIEMEMLVYLIGYYKTLFSAEVFCFLQIYNSSREKKMDRLTHIHAHCSE